MEVPTIETAAYLAANGKIEQDPSLIENCKKVTPAMITHLPPSLPPNVVTLIPSVSFCVCENRLPRS